MISSEDAPALKAALHRRFMQNQVNNRADAGVQRLAERRAWEAMGKGQYREARWAANWV